MRGWVGLRATAALAAGALAVACGGDAAVRIDCGALQPAADSADHNVVLVIADTLRRDASSVYGGTARTPALGSLARHGIVFERALAQAPWTKPSVATLFTSLHPSQHRLVTHAGTGAGIRARRQGAGGAAPALTDRLADGLTTLAERYRSAGFDTGAFVANPWLLGRYGFDQGFDVYDDRLARWNASGHDVSLAAIRWLAERAPDGRFLLYVHYLDPHLPYGPLDRERTLARAAEIAADARPVPPEALELIRSQARFADGSSALDAGLAPTLRLLELAYLAGVERFDAALGGLLDALDGGPHAARTAVIVSSDHGESLYAHGLGNHGSSLFQDEIAIPLLMRLPGSHPRAARDACPIGLVDLVPFLCAYSGLDCDPAALSGHARVLAGAKTADSESEWQVAEGVGGAPSHRALVGRRWKLVHEPEHRHGPSPELFFDLAEDADEQHNLALEAAPDAEARAALEALRAALPVAVEERGLPEPERVPLDDDARRRLEALGYLH